MQKYSKAAAAMYVRIEIKLKLVKSWLLGRLHTSYRASTLTMTVNKCVLDTRLHAMFFQDFKLRSKCNFY